MILALAACCWLAGTVHSASGSPVAAATVTASADSSAFRISTDAVGSFRLRVDPGRYVLRIRARGYVGEDVGPLFVDRDRTFDVALASVDAPVLRVIGSVRSDGTIVPSRAPVPTVDISRARMDSHGNDRVVDALATIPSVTFARPDGGNAAAPSVVALRGPDPSETLVALDGQILNDGNTGDLDLSRFPVAAFSNVSVTEGLGPEDIEGSDTIGGAVNLVSLQPTQHPQSAFSLSTGSFGRSEAWLNTTGTRGRLGYALALDDQQEIGYANQDALLCTDPASCGATTPLHLGSALSGRAALASLTWSFSPGASISARAFALGNSRDESAGQNTPFDPSRQGPGDRFAGNGAASLAQTIRSYDVRGHAPLGAGSLVYATSLSDNDVSYTGVGASPYDVTHRDVRQNLALSWLRSNDRSEVTFGGYLRHESLIESGVDGPQSQSIGSFFARGKLEPTRRLHLAGGIFASHYSSFGSNLDARAGGSYDIGRDSVVRASIGTGFRAPLLIERYVFPLADLVPDVNGVLLGQGNPNERPEHATEYELGYARRFGSAANLDIAFYRTNLRDAIENYYPLAAIGNPAPIGTYTSYPINVGNVVYTGVEVHYVRQMHALLVDARYGINVAYPYDLPAEVSNPTSGGTLVDRQQFLGIPQQQASLGLDYAGAAWHAALQTDFRGKNNALGRGPYATLDAAVGKRFGHADLTLQATNLTNAVAGRFTERGLGTPYRGLVPGPGGETTMGTLPTDAKFIEPAAVRLVLTVRN